MSSVDIVEDTVEVRPDKSDKSKAWLIKRYTLSNAAGTSIQIIDYGATITSIKLLDNNGVFEDIVFGYDDLAAYFGEYGENPYFGASIGRVANRTANGKFTLDGIEYNLTLNDNEHHLHGGITGFDKRMWESYVSGSKVIFSYLSRDTEEGYPGDVLAQITFELTNDNRLLIDYQATATKPTPINLTNHSYFNLSGHKDGDKKLSGHYILINADQYTPVDESLIVTGELKDVEGTKFDLRTSSNLHDLLQEDPSGFDHNFCINQEPGQDYNLAARFQHTESGRVLEVYSDQPGLQFYSGNFLPEEDGEPIMGKEGARYFKYGAVCLETQNYPNAVNVPHFPDPVIRPGQTYTHKMYYKFSLLNKKSKRISALKKK